MQTLAGGAVPLGTNVTTEPRFRTIGRAGPCERHFSGWRVSPRENRESVTDEQRNQALAVDRYGACRPGHPHLCRGLGPLIARLNSEFGEWTSRMQCPVSLAEEADRPTHWMPLPEPPTAGAADLAEHDRASLAGTGAAAAKPRRRKPGINQPAPT
jgi:hypothetical protein